MKSLVTTLCAQAALLLIASSTVTAHAQSTVNLSGVLDAYTGSTQLSGGLRQTRVESGGMTTSQFNIAMTEDLGGGVKAEGLLSAFLRADTGAQGRSDADPLFARGAWVGLITPYGSARIGRQTALTFANMIRTNSFGDSSAFSPVFLHTFRSAQGQGSQFLSGGAVASATSRGLTGALGTTDSAWNNAITLISPSFSGLTVSGMFAPGEVNGVGNRKSLTAFYLQGPLTLTAGADVFGAGAVPAAGGATAPLSKQTSYELTGAYALPVARISAGVFTHRRDYAAIVDDKIKTYYLGASIPVGAGSILLQSAYSRQSPDTGNSTKRTTTTLGYSHALSKRSELYAVYLRDKFTALSAGNTAVVGMRHRF